MVNDEKIRALAVKAIQELGDKATPDSVREYIERELGSESQLQNSKTDSGRVILTSFGINHPGIVSAISKGLSDSGCDILDISQKIMQEFFTMIMMIDITKSPKDLKELQEVMNNIGKELKVKIYLQHEDVFRYMHRI